MGHLMHQYPSDYVTMLIITIVLLLCPGTGLLLSDGSLIPGSFNGSDTFALASKSLDNETNFNELKNYPSNKVNRTSPEDKDLCSTQKFRTSAEIKKLSILVTNKAESMNQSWPTADRVQRQDFLTNESLNVETNENWTQDQRLFHFFEKTCTMNSSGPFSEITLSNMTSGKSVQETNDTLRPSMWSCSNLVKHFQTLMPGKYLITPYSKMKRDNTVKVKGNYENETDNDSTEISTSIQRHDLKNKVIENEADFESTEISTSIKDNTLKNTCIENKTHHENNDISTSIQKQSLNNSSSNTDNSLIPILDDLSDDTDAALTFTCKGRCGKKISFPCSCSATCVIYGTCCDNLTQDCPHVWYEGRNRFSHISRADLICDEDFLYKVVTCPKAVKENVEWSESVTSNTNKPLGGKESKIITTKKWFPFGVQTSPGTGDVTGSNSPTSSAIDGDPQETTIERLNRALSHAPITDSDTGLTFLNKAIYDCHNMSEITALRWSLVLDYTFVNPRKLEDFDNTGSLTKYQPDFDKRLLTAHLCISNVIETCDYMKKFQGPNIIYAENCPKSTAFLISGGNHYRNRFCAYCNEGRHNRYTLVSSHNVQFKGPDFRVLMSMSDSKTFNFKLSKSAHYAAGGIKLAWSLVSCSVPDQDISPGGTPDSAVWEAEKRSVCSVRCEDPSFTVRSDGLCKAEHHALLAVADDGLSPLCPSSVEGLARFLSCGLESEVESLRNADFSAPSASVMFDSTYKKNLYVVKLHMALPQTYNQVFSHVRKNLLKNIHHIALLARSFKDYRLSQTLCSQTKYGTDMPELKVIHTRVFADVSLYMDQDLSEGMEELRGQILDNVTTTTVCFGNLYSVYKADPNLLICIDDPVYERDATLIRKFRNSSCFAHLENLESAESSRAIGHKESHSFLLLWVLCLNILLMSTMDPPNVY
ncbi:hypothetical protein PoB_005965800 [Plakobranchus ocellatus]|uniref:SMB domain-containing protein n=1 Tax=Plakobranchus ocellatus TaxID=259542 RepID=A0AAV4CMI2_9GAST|nr:hypothetical protein PoB_005965800 [Plakobranchus ocellatus]